MSTPNTPIEGAPEGAGQQTQSPEPTPAPEATPGEVTQISNAELKANPVFQKVTSELAQLRQEKAEREQAEQAAKDKAEADALKAQGKFEEAEQIWKDKFEAQEKKHSKDILERDLKQSLTDVGFHNSTFLSGAISGYSGDSAGIAEYVKGLAEDEGNKMFLDAGRQRQTLPEPPKTPKAGGTMTIEDAMRLSKESKDPEIRSQARKVKGAYIEKHGRLPG